MDELPQLAPGVVLVRLGSAGLDGVALIEALARTRYDSPVVAFMEEPDMESAINCLRRGAVDVVVRVYCTEALEEAVAYAERVLEQRRPAVEQFCRDEAALRRLTRREHEVLKCLASGLTSKSMSERLSLSARTVEFYRSSLIDKLGCSTSAAAVALLVRHETFHEARVSIAAHTDARPLHTA